jgi:hypothetical protein
MIDGSTPIPFPRFEARDLEGRRVVLPDDLPGPCDLLVLAFRRGQQGDVDGWRDAVAALGVPGIGFWEVPVIGRAWNPMRGWIDGGMARAIPDIAVRTHTLTAYTDTGMVRAAVGIDGPGRVAPMLVVDGVVRWQGRGPATPDAVAGLAEAVGSHGGAV